MANNYGTIREYRDDPNFQEYRDDSDGSVAEITESIRSNIFKINNGGKICFFYFWGICDKSSNKTTCIMIETENVGFLVINK